MRKMENITREEMDENIDKIRILIHDCLGSEIKDFYGACCSATACLQIAANLISCMILSSNKEFSISDDSFKEHWEALFKDYIKIGTIFLSQDISYQMKMKFGDKWKDEKND